MGIIQENRLDAPYVEVKETDYGATYVKAATESAVQEAPADSAESGVPAERENDDENDAAPTAEPAKKKAGRPKKNTKK